MNASSAHRPYSKLVCELRRLDPTAEFSELGIPVIAAASPPEPENWMASGLDDAVAFYSERSAADIACD